MSLRVLVTGGAGFLGSHLCDHLLRRGISVWCVDNLSSGQLRNIEHLRGLSSFRFIRADVRDPLPDLEVDRIYNLACPASPRHYQADPIGTLHTSVLGATHALQLGLKTGARILQASTSEIYGDPEVHPQIEAYVGAVNCTGVRACYDEGKRAAETLFFDYHRTRAAQVRVVRLFNSYGPRMQAGDGRVVPNFINQALRGAPLTVYGDGSQTRSFCFCDDTVSGLVACMEADGGRIGPINVGNPMEFTISQLAALVIELTQSTSRIVNMPLPEDDPKLRRPDISLARQVLGWQPSTCLEEGLRQMIDDARRMMGGGELTAAPRQGRPAVFPS